MTTLTPNNVHRASIGRDDLVIESTTEKHHDTDQTLHDASSTSSKDLRYNEVQYQPGVQRARAVTATWSRKTLYIMFAIIYLASFVDMLLTSVQQALNPYITSAFGRHGLLAATSVVSTILGGSSKLTLAKIIDIWGRVEGFLFMLLIMVIGLIMKAVSQNIQTYTAAHTLYWVGHLGLMYVIDVMLSDMSSLQNRALVLAINYTPTIATTFLGPRVAQAFYTDLNFRWAYGAFAIMVTGVCIPIAVVMLLEERKALKIGQREKGPASGRNWWQSIGHYFIQLDVIGIVLVTAAFSLILLPFSIATYAPKKWATGYIIAMEVLGILCLPAFYFWERYSPVPFLDWKYLKDRTFIGSCLLYGLMFVSTFCWNGYFNSYLQVVHRLSITTAGYVLNSYSLTSAIISPLVGLLITYTGQFKYISYAGIPIFLLGTALLIPFRTPSTNVGVLAITQILVGLGAGIFTTTGQLAIMVPITQQEIAAVLAIWSLFGSIGASIGIAIAGAMWNQILPGQLYNRLPDAAKANSTLIFGDIVQQMAFPDGSPERDAVVGAYADVQRKMVIAGACFVPLCLTSIYMWRNVNVKKLERDHGKQTRGMVF